MKEQITFDDFDKVDIRVGTVISVRKNEKARKPSLVVEVDFGEEIGIKQSSAQITTSTTKDGFLAFSFFFTEITVPTLISTLSKSSKVICSLIIIII